LRFLVSLKTLKNLKFGLFQIFRFLKPKPASTALADATAYIETYAVLMPCSRIVCNEKIAAEISAIHLLYYVSNPR